MITKEDFIASLSKELNIIKHLAEKITNEQLSYRPTDKQRSLQELLHYLSYVFIASVESVVMGDKSFWEKHSQTDVPTLEKFGSLIDSQSARINNLLSDLTDEDFKKEVDVWFKETRANHLLGTLKYAAAYKMQLFLYMKQSGTENIGTMNLWVGIDQPTQ
jgi:hypothetical protein